MSHSNVLHFVGVVILSFDIQGMLLVSQQINSAAHHTTTKTHPFLLAYSFTKSIAPYNHCPISYIVLLQVPICALYNYRRLHFLQCFISAFTEHEVKKKWYVPATTPFAHYRACLSQGFSVGWPAFMRSTSVYMSANMLRTCSAAALTQTHKLITALPALALCSSPGQKFDLNLR
jgi:hypothetical protein